MQEVRFSQGERIFSEGDPGTMCYKILSGRVDIQLNLPGTMRRDQVESVGTCGPGEIIGAMSAIAKGNRSASAIAVDDTICTALTPGEVIEMLENDPLEGLAYMRTLIRHQRESNRKIVWTGRRR